MLAKEIFQKFQGDFTVKVNIKCSKICIFVCLKTIESPFLSFKFRLTQFVFEFLIR